MRERIRSADLAANSRHFLIGGNDRHAISAWLGVQIACCQSAGAADSRLRAPLSTCPTFSRFPAPSVIIVCRTEPPPMSSIGPGAIPSLCETRDEAIAVVD